MDGTIQLAVVRPSYQPLRTIERSSAEDEDPGPHAWNVHMIISQYLTFAQ